VVRDTAPDSEDPHMNLLYIALVVLIIVVILVLLGVV
jgi:hypothetical protein